MLFRTSKSEASGWQVMMNISYLLMFNKSSVAMAQDKKTKKRKKKKRGSNTQKWYGQDKAWVRFFHESPAKFRWNMRVFRREQSREWRCTYDGYDRWEWVTQKVIRYMLSTTLTFSWWEVFKFADVERFIEVGRDTRPDPKLTSCKVYGRRDNCRIWNSYNTIFK